VQVVHVPVSVPVQAVQPLSAQALQTESTKLKPEAQAVHVFVPEPLQAMQLVSVQVLQVPFVK